MHSLQSNNKVRAVTQPRRLQITFSGIIPTEATVANFMHFMITINQQEEINIFLIIPLVNPGQLYFQKPVQWPKSHSAETWFQEAIFWQRVWKLQVKLHPHSTWPNVRFTDWWGALQAVLSQCCWGSKIDLSHQHYLVWAFRLILCMYWYPLILYSGFFCCLGNLEYIYTVWSFNPILKF